MHNLWSNINDSIPIFMNDLCLKYNLKCVKISPLKTAMLGEGFAILIGVDRFDIEMYYIYPQNKNIKKHPCGSYFAQFYDCNDRGDLLDGEGAEISLKNSLIIIAKGMSSKWEDVLKGEINWLEKYKNSSRYANLDLTAEEKNVFDKYFFDKN